jgi:hypothetical protein
MLAMWKRLAPLRGRRAQRRFAVGGGILNLNTPFFFERSLFGA